MGSPIPNRFTQTLGFPNPIRIIQTHKQIAFQNKNIAGYNLKTCKLDRSRHLSSFNESRQIELLSRRYRGLQICTFLEQFLSSLHVFNLTTCNDHLEPTQIFPNTNKVRFVKGYANYIKICPQQHGLQNYHASQYERRSEFLENSQQTMCHLQYDQ